MLKVVKGINELAYTNRFETFISFDRNFKSILMCFLFPCRVYVSPTEFQKLAREGADIGISISKGDPQINLLCGTTFVFLAR